jgi:hypothetical protein
MNFVKGLVLSGALLLPVVLAAQDTTQDRGEVRAGRRQVRKDRKAAVTTPVGQGKIADQRAAQKERKAVRSDRRETRQDRQEATPKQ